LDCRLLYDLPQQSLRLLLVLHQVLEFVIGLRGQLKEECHLSGNRRVRFISIRGFQNLILGLCSQFLLNGGETERFLANPPELEVSPQPDIPHPAPYGFIGYFLRLTLHAG
jgi:hypothetical protein